MYRIEATHIDFNSAETVFRTFAHNSTLDDCRTILEGISQADTVRRASYGDDFLTLVNSDSISSYRIVADSSPEATSDQGIEGKDYIRLYPLFGLSPEAERFAIEDHWEKNPVCGGRMSEYVSRLHSSGIPYHKAISQAYDIVYRVSRYTLQDCGYRYTKDGVRMY